MTPRTSVTHPIDLSIIAPHVGLTFAPGKRASSAIGARWERDLDADLDRLRAVHGVELLVSLLEPHEREAYGIPRLLDAARARGMRVAAFPIVDGGTPASPVEVRPIVEEIREAALAGRTVAIHCRGGLGRAGTNGRLRARRPRHVHRRDVPRPPPPERAMPRERSAA